MSIYNINVDLFKRYRPENKLEIIKSFNEREFLSIKKDTIERMVKEAGIRMSAKHVAKELRLDRDFAHNNGNSCVESIYQGDHRGELFMNIYLQGYDTDTNICCTVKTFLSSTELLGKFEETYLHGDSCMIHARYTSEDKARVIKAICLAYVHNKYNI